MTLIPLTPPLKCNVNATNRRPLIMMWSKTAPKGTKRAKVTSTTDDGAATHHGNPEKKMKVADLATKIC